MTKLHDTNTRQATALLGQACAAYDTAVSNAVKSIQAHGAQSVTDTYLLRWWGAMIDRCEARLAEIEMVAEYTVRELGTD